MMKTHRGTLLLLGEGFQVAERWVYGCLWTCTSCMNLALGIMKYKCLLKLFPQVVVSTVPHFHASSVFPLFSHSRSDFFIEEEVLRDNKLFLSSVYLPVFVKYVAFEFSVPP